MIIKKVFVPADNIVSPLEIVKPVTTLKGNIYQDLCITENGDFYKYSELQEKEFLSECEKNPITVHKDKNGRLYCGIDPIREIDKNCQVGRIVLFAFEEKHHKEEWYEKMEVDHINPSIPVENGIRNIRWVTHEDNMRAASETGVMLKKYTKPLIHEICQLISDGKTRAEIVEQLGIHASLVDDIHSGRSHKIVSEKYLDKGFSYQHFPRRPRTERLKEAHNICKLLEKGIPNREICRRLGVASGLVTSVKKGISYKDISSQYNIK